MNPNSTSSVQCEESSRPGDTLENPIVFTMRKSSKPMMGRALSDVGPEDSASNVSSRASSTACTAKLQARRAEMDSLAAAEAAERAVMKAEFEAAHVWAHNRRVAILACLRRYFVVGGIRDKPRKKSVARRVPQRKADTDVYTQPHTHTHTHTCMYIYIYIMCIGIE